MAAHDHQWDRGLEINEEIIFKYRYSGVEASISACIVDEATQSVETETLIPLMLGVRTLVLVGDTNQLPPTILSQVRNNTILELNL